MSAEAPRPRISVIMNCLDGEKDLPAALRSVQEQTCQDFEIIFLDNGSTDQSPAIAKGFGPKLRYFRNEAPRPLGAARNQAIAHARGDLIAFLDCDDLWLPEKLERQEELFRKNPALGLACTDTEIFRGGKVLSRLFAGGEPPRGRVFGELIKRQWISMSSAMLRREALESVREGQACFDERLNVCEEADLFYRVAHDWELDHASEALTRWRIHSQNSTFRKFNQFAEETRLILEKHLRIYPGYEREHADLVRLLRGRAAFQGALALWRDGKGRQARKAMNAAGGGGVKWRLLWLASFLPGSLFDPCARLYFALPASLRRG